MILGIGLIVLSVCGGLSFWLYTLIAWGIGPIIEGATAPVDWHLIGWGIAWIFLSKVIGIIIAGLGSGVGVYLMAYMAEEPAQGKKEKGR